MLNINSFTTPELSPEAFERRAAIFAALQQIPFGKVTTYGELARRANLANGARIVGKTLKDLPPNTELPWHRVVNAQGKISLPPNSASYNEQCRRLSDEGVEVMNGKIPLSRYCV